VKTEPFEPLDPALYREIVRRALAEDLGWGDVTTESTVAADARARARIVSGTDCVIAGLDIAEEVLRQLDPAVTMTRHVAEGGACRAGTTVCTVEGSAAPLLTAERTALNFLQRLSGIATLTRRFVEASQGRLVVLDTRETTPTLRALERHAVRAGGGANHRVTLDDGIVVSRNHLALTGGIRPAVARIRAAGLGLPLEVEVTSPDEAEEALVAGVTRLLVDERCGPVVAEIVRRARGRARVEVGGRITLDRLPALVAAGAEFVSIAALTSSAAAVEMRLEIESIP
jgi:nicotinate-nucleotide pyrophosphorylase (carboxylating)